MIPLIKLIAVLILMPTISFGSETIITFSDSAITNNVIKVEKFDSIRTFYQCKSFEGKIDPESCVEIDQISVITFDTEQAKLSNGEIFSWEAAPEIIGTAAGTVISFIPALELGSSIAFYSSYGSPRPWVGFGVVIGAGATIGYFLGDVVDGKEFTALETASIRSALIHPEILESKNKKNVKFDISLSIYRTALITASRALSARE